MNTEVSIIVPIYNVEQYLKKCLDSLINQTYKKIKIYAVIDGSPDNSIEIVKKYAKKDKRIICIDKENGGYGSVLEETIGIIDTKYFMICDPDDWLSKDAVFELVSVAEKDDLDIVVGDKYIVYSNDNEELYVSSNNKHNEIKSNHIYTDPTILSLLSVSPHAKLYKTEYAKNIKFPRKVSYTDFLLYMGVLSNAKKGIYIDKPLAYYLIDRIGNTTTDKSKKAFCNQIIVFKSTINQISNKYTYLHFKLYEQYRYLFIELLSNMSNEDKKSIDNELNCIFDLKKYKKEIIKTLKELNNRKLNIVICNLLFSKIFNRLMINILVKIFKRKSSNNEK